MRRINWRLGRLGILAAMLGAGAVVSTGCGLLPPLQSVASVDLQRYAGLWYEIAKYPVPFQVGCVGVTAEYTLQENGTVRVLNTCREGTLDGPARTIEGTAVVTNAANNSQLAVFFFGFPGAYWIIDLDVDYQWAVVSEPTRSTCWILSRTPTLDAGVYQGILDRLAANGFDVNRIVPTPQPPAP